MAHAALSRSGSSSSDEGDLSSRPSYRSTAVVVEAACRRRATSMGAKAAVMVPSTSILTRQRPPSASSSAVVASVRHTHTTTARPQSSGAAAEGAVSAQSLRYVSLTPVPIPSEAPLTQGFTVHSDVHTQFGPTSHASDVSFDRFGERLRGGDTVVKYTFANPFFEFVGSYEKHGHRRGGHGCLLMADGSSYTGDFAATSGEMTGTGRRTWADGSYYEGEFVDGEAHGTGRHMDATTRAFYNGDWHYGHRHGKGRWELPRPPPSGSIPTAAGRNLPSPSPALAASLAAHPDGVWNPTQLPGGATYVGEWRNHRFDGVGLLSEGLAWSPTSASPALRMTSGTFSKGFAEGHCRTEYGNGDVYEGQLVHGIEHGYCARFDSPSAGITSYACQFVAGARIAVGRHLALRSVAVGQKSGGRAVEGGGTVLGASSPLRGGHRPNDSYEWSPRPPPIANSVATSQLALASRTPACLDMAAPRASVDFGEGSTMSDTSPGGSMRLFSGGTPASALSRQALRTGGLIRAASAFSSSFRNSVRRGGAATMPALLQRVASLTTASLTAATGEKPLTFERPLHIAFGQEVTVAVHTARVAEAAASTAFQIFGEPGGVSSLGAGSPRGGGGDAAFLPRGAAPRPGGPTSRLRSAASPNRSGGVTLALTSEQEAVESRDAEKPSSLLLLTADHAEVELDDCDDGREVELRVFRVDTRQTSIAAACRDISKALQVDAAALVPLPKDSPQQHSPLVAEMPTSPPLVTALEPRAAMNALNGDQSIPMAGRPGSVVAVPRTVGHRRTASAGSRTGGVNNPHPTQPQETPGEGSPLSATKPQPTMTIRGVSPRPVVDTKTISAASSALLYRRVEAMRSRLAKAKPERRDGVSSLSLLRRLKRPGEESDSAESDSETTGERDKAVESIAAARLRQASTSTRLGKSTLLESRSSVASRRPSASVRRRSTAEESAATAPSSTLETALGAEDSAESLHPSKDSDDDDGADSLMETTRASLLSDCPGLAAEGSYLIKSTTRKGVATFVVNLASAAPPSATPNLDALAAAAGCGHYILAFRFSGAPVPIVPGLSRNHRDIDTGRPSAAAPGVGLTHNVLTVPLFVPVPETPEASTSHGKGGRKSQS